MRRVNLFGDHYVLHEIPEPETLLILGLGVFGAIPREVCFKTKTREI